jgi:DDB1- and CUL4-associated factor 5
MRLILTHFPNRKLTKHTSCVNALAYSGDGRFLASGGDGKCKISYLFSFSSEMYIDLEILLWDFHQESLKEPSYALRGPQVRMPFIQMRSSEAVTV